MDIKVLDDNPLYLDQTYRLKFLFSSSYPIGESLAGLAFSILPSLGFMDMLFRAFLNLRPLTNTRRSSRSDIRER